MRVIETIVNAARKQAIATSAIYNTTMKSILTELSSMRGKYGSAGE